MQERPDAVALSPTRGEVTFDAVTFGYLRTEPVLRDFSLTVHPGETVALVGTSGSGKSTVGLLLPRFYDVHSGAVRIDDVDVRDVTLTSLREQIGVVFEDSFLFSDTIRNNIAFARPDASDADVEAARARSRPTSSSSACRTGTRRWWASRASPSPAANASASRSPARC